MDNREPSVTQPVWCPASAPGRGSKIAQPVPSVAYTTARGVMYRGFAEDVLRSALAKKYRAKVQLILTSPPFPLNRKKKYGNRQGEEYLEWLAGFAPLFREFLTNDGSIVIEMGNAWEAGEPAMSTLALEALLAFLKRADLRLPRLSGRDAGPPLLLQRTNVMADQLARKLTRKR